MIRSIIGERRVSRWSLAVTLLLAGVLLFFALRGVDWHESFHTIRHSQADYLIVALLTLTLSYFLRGIRWRVLLSARKQTSPLTIFLATAVGYLGNSFLPARAGDVIRVMLTGRRTRISKSYLVATALIERVVDTVALVLISSIALLWIRDMPGWLNRATQIMTLLGIVGIAGLFAAPALEGVLRKIVNRLPIADRLRARMLVMIEEFLLGMRALRHLGRAANFLGLTVVIWLLDATMAVEIARALRVHLSLPQALLLLSALGLASAVPSTPGYVGIYQFVAVTVLVPFGLSRNDAIAYILVFQAIISVISLLWGLLGIWRLTLSRQAPESSNPQALRVSEYASPDVLL